jgi:hypothetical protein
MDCCVLLYSQCEHFYVPRLPCSLARVPTHREIEIRLLRAVGSLFLKEPSLPLKVSFDVTGVPKVAAKWLVVGPTETAAFDAQGIRAVIMPNSLD